MHQHLDECQNCLFSFHSLFQHLFKTIEQEGFINWRSDETVMVYIIIIYQYTVSQMDFTHQETYNSLCGWKLHSCVFPLLLQFCEDGTCLIKMINYPKENVDRSISTLVPSAILSCYREAAWTVTAPWGGAWHKASVTSILSFGLSSSLSILFTHSLSLSTYTPL